MTSVDNLGDIASSHGLYPVQAYAFVAEALRDTSCRHGESCSCGDHIGASELVDGLLDLSAQRFGLLAGLVLRSWGLRSSHDVGRITFHLVEHGIFGKLPDDRLEDFDPGPDFMRAIRERIIARL